MKKVLIVAAAVLLSISALAQAEHLKFKGIPIDGEYKAFAEQLVQKDFKQIETSADGIVLSGNFMATPEVIVLIYPDPTSKRVSSVSTMFKAGDNWATFEAKYYDVIDMYKEKYGAPTQHAEEFTVDVHNDDFFRKSALHDGQCNYTSIWEKEGGRIVLSLAYSQLSYYVICTYVDEQNEKALRQTIIDDI